MSPQPPFPSTPSSQAAQLQSLVSFLEHEPDPMIVLDTAHNILAANRAYLRQFGSVDQPVIGHKCYRISHHYDVPCDQAGEHCPLKKAQEPRGADRVLHIHHAPRGPEHVEVELRPIFDAIRAKYLPAAPVEAVRAPAPGASWLTELLPTFDGTRRELAAHLGLSERTLYRRLKARGLA